MRLLIWSKFNRMADQDSTHFLRISTYCAAVPLAGTVAIFLCWILFRSDALVMLWILGFVMGLAAVALGATCLMIAIVQKIFRRHWPWPMSQRRTLATIAFLIAYFPASAFTAQWYFQLTRLPSNDIVHAASRKHISLNEVKQFLDDDPDCVNSQNENGVTALHAATGQHLTEMVRLLISRGADVEVRDNYGATALHYATDNYSVPIIDVLIAAGADPNSKDADGRIPLHSAAKWGNAKAVKSYLDHGADVNATNDDGQTPLDLADAQMQIQAAPPAHLVERWDESIRILRARGGVYGSKLEHKH